MIGDGFGQNPFSGAVRVFQRLCASHMHCTPPLFWVLEGWEKKKKRYTSISCLESLPAAVCSLPPPRTCFFWRLCSVAGKCWLAGDEGSQRGDEESQRERETLISAITGNSVC